MAFPSIRVDEPKGEWRVSEIDNAERLTRSWLVQCMQQISGYPDVNTIGVKGWTSNTRPNTNPNGNYLLGFNTETQSLEVLGANGNVLQELNSKSIALLAHPVGTYFWTSNASFNPNNAWGGTWVRIQDGRCLISNNPDWGSNYNVGKQNGDTRTVQLEKKHLPVLTLEHDHGVGSYEITGKITSKEETEYKEYFTTADRFTNDGALKIEDKVSGAQGILLSGIDNAVAYRSLTLQADSKHGFSGKSAKALKDVGSGVAHNNMPPYTVAILWHRTA